MVKSCFFLLPVRLLCPWDFPGKNTGRGCHFLLQGIFPTQGSNQPLLHWQVDSLSLSNQELPPATRTPQPVQPGESTDPPPQPRQPAAFIPVPGAAFSRSPAFLSKPHPGLIPAPGTSLGPALGCETLAPPSRSVPCQRPVLRPLTGRVSAHNRALQAWFRPQAGTRPQPRP